MTNYAELIAEADVRRIRQETHTHSVEGDGDLIARLAAAVRELAPPQGWRVTEYCNSEKKVFEVSGKYWIATNRGVSLVVRDDWEHTNLPTIVEFPTASAAMAALDGDRK